jgi:branched-chain amino acid transport system ATP-binding protein
MLLQVIKLESRYGSVPAISNVDLQVTIGEIVTVIGSNGTGKSTLLKTVTGHMPPWSGSVIFLEQDVTFWPPWELIRLGMTLVPEGRHLFGSLSVEENLFLGTFPHRKKLKKKSLRNEIEFIYNLFPGLRERSKQTAKTLSGGEQQMLAVGRGLVSNPKLLLLDEPSLGLAPLVKKEIFKTLNQLHREKKTTILLVEQDVKGALEIADRGYLMQTGRIILEDEAKALAKNQAVKEIYLGKT